MIGYLDAVIRPLVLILSKISGYVKTCKVKDGDEDKNNKLMFLRVDDERLLEKYKTIWTKTEDLKNIKLNALPVYYDRYIKTKIKIYGDKINTNFRGLNESKDDIKCKSFTAISIDSLLVYKSKYYLQVYLAKCAYKTVEKPLNTVLR